jgi:cyanophycinase
VIIGGGEDRRHDKVILERFVALAGGPQARVFVLTAASTEPAEMWAVYEKAFRDMGVLHVTTADISHRKDACNPSTEKDVSQASGIFITGGDQKRLMALIGGTPIDLALHHALRHRGACIGGTSAGASAMSAHMLFDGSKDLLPHKGSVHLGAGLGLVPRVIIDQHFSERQRLGRLLSVVAQNPYLLGAGIDEDTALIVCPGHSLEVIGQGAVTLIDGREMQSNLDDVKRHGTLELADVRLHLLPAGVRYGLEHPTPASSGETPCASLSDGLRDAIAAVTSLPGHERELAEPPTHGAPA